SPKSQSTITYGTNLKVKFKVSGKIKGPVKVTMVFPSFTTHSFSMNQRLLVKRTSSVFGALFGKTKHYEVQVRTPKSAIIAPPGYYMMFVVNENVPSEGIWVRLQ
ncbi:unnamed protein product, partial [Brassica napus]